MTRRFDGCWLQYGYLPHGRPIFLIYPPNNGNLRSTFDVKTGKFKVGNHFIGWIQRPTESITTGLDTYECFHLQEAHSTKPPIYLAVDINSMSYK